MSPYEELFELVEKLSEAASWGTTNEVARPISALEKAANEVKRSFSGSWLGYHAYVYYLGLDAAFGVV